MDVYDFDFETYVKKARAEIICLGETTPTISGGRFAQRLADAVEQGLRRLDQTPRADPFWTGKNELPTMRKLSNFAALHATDVDLAMAALAIGLHEGSARIASSVFWKLDREYPIEWLAEAGWLFFQRSGQRLSMVKTSHEIGREKEYQGLLRELACATHEGLRDWAEGELASIR